MRKTLITTALAALIAGPAPAQLLGGGAGLGGTLGGATGSLGRIGSSTTGSVTKSGSIRAERSIDRRSGRVSGNASGSSAASGSGANSTSLLGRTLSGGGSGSASGSGAAGADAQLIGTDAVHSAVDGARGLMSGAGGLTGSGSAAGAGSASFADGAVSGMGEAAGSVAKNITIAPGTLIQDSRGRVIGAVQEVRTNARGAVQSVLVRVGEAQTLVPVDNFSVSGDGSALVSAMGKGELRKTAERQGDSETASR